jgi:hypothetical protein
MFRTYRKSANDDFLDSSQTRDNTYLTWRHNAKPAAARQRPCATGSRSLAWEGIALIGMYWRPLRASSAPTIFLAIAIGCFANWVRTRTFHCMIAGPLFLVVGFLLLLSEFNAIQLDREWLCPIVIIGIGVAYLLEWRYAQHSAKG